MSKTSNPQKKRKSVPGIFRPVFVPDLRSGNTGIDLVTGTLPTTVISGTRYGIINGVVTQLAVNQPPIEDDGLRGCPAFTQLAKMSEILTNDVWSKTNIVVSSDTPVNGVAAWKITENTTANVPHSLVSASSFTDISDNSVVGISMVAKYNGRLLEIISKIKDGTFPVICRINLQTGVISNLRSGSVASCVAIGGGFYRVFATIDVGSGAFDPYLYPQLHTGSTNIYTGDGVSGIYISQFTLINFGVNGIPFTPPYIPNDTGGALPVVSETTGTSFDLDDVKLSRLRKNIRGFVIKE